MCVALVRGGRCSVVFGGRRWTAFPFQRRFIRCARMRDIGMCARAFCGVPAGGASLTPVAQRPSIRRAPPRPILSSELFFTHPTTRARAREVVGTDISPYAALRYLVPRPHFTFWFLPPRYCTTWPRCCRCTAPLNAEENTHAPHKAANAHRARVNARVPYVSAWRKISLVMKIRRGGNAPCRAVNDVSSRAHLLHCNVAPLPSYLLSVPIWFPRLFCVSSRRHLNTGFGFWIWISKFDLVWIIFISFYIWIPIYS